MADAFGIAPNSPALQTGANLSQLNVLKSGGADETRTRTFLIDNQTNSLCSSAPNSLTNREDLIFEVIVGSPLSCLGFFFDRFSKPLQKRLEGSDLRKTFLSLIG